MTWAQRLKRVFAIDIETCGECGGDVRIIACIEAPEVIRKILAHLDEKVISSGAVLLPEPRAPPVTGLFACMSEIDIFTKLAVSDGKRRGICRPENRNWQ